MKYSKIRDVKTLSRGTSRSAGIDFYVPTRTDEYLGILYGLNKDTLIGRESSFLIKPHSHALIPSGIMINVASCANYCYTKHSGLALIAHNKSSIGIKQLDVAATVIDEDYQGEIHLSITNTSEQYIEILYGQKLVQFVLIPILLEQFDEVERSELFNSESERLSGGFGSTGT